MSGLSNSWLLVGSVHALFTTRYGALLLCKLMLFVILLGFGARNRSFVKTELGRAPALSDLLSQLRRNVISELCLGVVVVAIVGWLGAIPPARAGSVRARIPVSIAAFPAPADYRSAKGARSPLGTHNFNSTGNKER